MISKHIYLIHRWDPNRHNHFVRVELGVNGNEVVLYNPQISKSGASPSDAV